MGLSIHYSGTLKSVADIDNLSNEVADICESLKWSYNIIDPKDEPIHGISFAPEGSEPLFLTFLPDGRICSLLSFVFKEMYPERPFEPQYTVSAKTQYAGMDAHIAIIKLLKYLKGKYFSSFELLDEGNYWETDDKKKLKSQFDDYEKVLEILTSALENIKIIPREPAGSLADRIEKILNEKLKGRNE